MFVPAKIVPTLLEVFKLNSLNLQLVTAKSGDIHFYKKGF
jgi:hypothetical protein